MPVSTPLEEDFIKVAWRLTFFSGGQCGGLKPDCDTSVQPVKGCKVSAAGSREGGATERLDV